jgi:hypothetical protein
VATTATSVVTGDASAVVNAAHGAPPGLQVALSHVPSTSHAFEVLKLHLSMYAGTGAAGTTVAGGATVAIKHGLHLGPGR